MRVVCRRKGRGSARMLLPPSRRAWYRTRFGPANVAHASKRSTLQPTEPRGSDKTPGTAVVGLDAAAGATRARGTGASRSGRPSRAGAAGRAGRSGCRGSGSGAAAPRRRTRRRAPGRRRRGGPTGRACANGNAPSGAVSPSAVTFTPSIFTVLPRREREQPAGRDPGDGDPAAQVPEPGNRLARPAPARAGVTEYVSYHWRSPAELGAGTRRVDSIARRRSSSARIIRASLGVGLRTRERRHDTRTGCRRSGRGSCRSPPAGRAWGRPWRPRRARHAGAPPSRRGRGRPSGGSARRRRLRAASCRRAGRACPPAAWPRRRATGRSSLPASAGAAQSEWSRVQSQAHAAFGLSGSLPAGLNAAQPHDQTLAEHEARPPPACAAIASHLTTSSHFESGCRPSRPPALGVELKVSIIPSRFVGTPIWIRSSRPRRASSRAAGGCLRRRPASRSAAPRSRPRGRCPPPATRPATTRRRPRSWVYGRFESSRNGRAPRSCSRCRYASTFARYCAVVAVHGVGNCAPKSSFSAISGWSQPEDVTAVSKSLSARAWIVEGSAGLDGVPTRLFR